MRFCMSYIFILLVSAVEHGITLDSGGYEQDSSLRIVQDALNNETLAYDEMLRSAMVQGAQSRRHSREAVKSTKETEEIGRIGTIFRRAFQSLTKRNAIPVESVQTHLLSLLPKQCQKQELNCDSKSKYRKIDGTCNNLENPNWGATNSPSVRLLPPAYVNGDEPRGGLNPTDLPPARNVSLKVHIGKGEAYENMVTHIVAQFGQFLDHDITLTPVENFACCKNSKSAPECWPIQVYKDDDHYRPHNVTCLDFVRSTQTCSASLGFAHREQFNAITAYIDGSVVYGSDSERASTLRNGSSNGKLAENSKHLGFLPWAADVITGGLPDQVIAGDIRANEMPGLTVLHSLFHREHNRIAGELSRLRPDWDDEKVFQETRRIIGAELQQVTYGEFLPAILGLSAMRQYGLELPADLSSYTKYDNQVNATIFNSFATAAYRFGHTLVNGLIQLFMDDKNIGSYNVRDNYLNSSKIVDFTDGNDGSVSGYDLILNGLVKQPAQAYDGEIHTDMTNHLFKTVDFVGSDLAARNIQRGRDHGVPSYNEFRKFCELSSLPETFATEEIPLEFSNTSWTKLKNAGYKSPHDIDLYTGGLSEIPIVGALSGPTFVCLQAKQFERLMKGDRFFFTHENVAGTFSQEQLVALRRRSLGDIICENSKIKEVQTNVFYFESVMNPVVACASPSRKLDIKLFAELTTTKENSAGQITFTNLFLLIMSFLSSFAVGGGNILRIL